MNIREAENLVYSNFNMFNKNIDKVSESKNYFIFSTVTIDENGNALHLFIPPICVHKKTGRVARLNIMDFSKDELASIKRIR